VDCQTARRSGVQSLPKKLIAPSPTPNTKHQGKEAGGKPARDNKDRTSPHQASHPTPAPKEEIARRKEKRSHGARKRDGTSFFLALLAFAFAFAKSKSDKAQRTDGPGAHQGLKPKTQAKDCGKD